MKVLVTGGTGVIGEGTVAALSKRGHEVRLLHDVTSAAAVRGTAKGRDAIVHVAGIDEESPPDLTFDKVNVLGTRHVVAEAERAKVGRLVFVSSLGADTGASDYHRSKRRAEQSVRGCSRPWVVLRPAAVYGPGDRNLSAILQMVRNLPAVPVVDGGDQRFQPLWYEDAGEAIARAVDAPGITGRILDLAGPEQTTVNDLLDRLEALVGRKPRRVHVPAGIASMSVHVATLLGFKLPISEARLTMLQEENVIAPGGKNALAAVLGVEPTPLDEGLERLTGQIPEQLPAEGVGPLVHKRYWADIDGSFYRAEALRDVFRRNLGRVLPFEATRDGGPLDNVKKNMTFTVMVPLRGALSMRVEDITPTRVVASTLQGHPLAGLLTFDFLERGTQVRFEIGVYARGADFPDAVLMAAIFDFLQDMNWRQAVENMVKLSGGHAREGVQMLVTPLLGEEARKVEEWAAQLAVRRMRGRVPPGPPVDGRRRARREPPPPPKPRRPRASRPGSRRRPAGAGSARRSRAGSGSGRTSGRAAPPAGARTAAKRPTPPTGRGAAGRGAARSRPRPKGSAPKARRAGATRGTRGAESTGTAPARRGPAKGRRRK